MGLLPAYWRRGLATEAADAVLRDAFDRLAAPEIVAARAPTAKVINIMDALKKSVQQGKGAAAKSPAKRAAAKSKKTAKAAPKRKSA